MSLVHQISQSLLLVPNSYDALRPHHAVVAYGVASFVASTSLLQSLSKQLLGWCSALTERCIPLIHLGLVPDWVIRFGIRLQLKDHLRLLASDDCETELHRKLDIVQKLRDMPIAVETEAANEQHYEVPAEFYSLCLVRALATVPTDGADAATNSCAHIHYLLHWDCSSKKLSQGPCKKYSSGLWNSPTTTFEESEVAMLDLYCERAGVKDGMSIVDLGCGWGSLTLHLAAKYPHCRITGISNSHSQREYILHTAQERGLTNVQIVTVRRRRCRPPSPPPTRQM